MVDQLINLAGLTGTMVIYNFWGERAISKIGNGESENRNGKRGMGMGNLLKGGISKRGNLLRRGISKRGNLLKGESLKGGIY